MIRVVTDGVCQYRLVEETQVTRTETRTIAVSLSREDADRIAELLNRAAATKPAVLPISGCQCSVCIAALQAEANLKVNLKLDGLAYAAYSPFDVPSSRYPGTFENAVGYPCPCGLCRMGRP